jgi:RNA polymerase primary sigma factor
MRDGTPPVGRAVNRLMKLAVAAGSENAVLLHISRGDDLEWRDDRGFTPLMIAASRDRAGVCRLLIEAGVDRHAIDTSGRDALMIAREAGASAAAEIIASFLIDSSQQPVDREAAETTSLSSSPSGEPGACSGDIWPVSPIEATTQAHEATSATQPEESSELGDYGDWEAEDDRAAPAHDPKPVQEQSALQRAISDHVPIDDSADWDDFEAYLPEMAAPLARAESAEFQVALRAIVLRAAREGSVPSQVIEELYSSGRGEDARDVEAEGALLRVLNDLGAEVDERFEYASNDDGFRVAQGPDETWDETEAVDDAMAALSALTERPKDPLRMQRRETQRIDLLTAEQEVELAQAMETATEAALDAMASWSKGLSAFAEIIDDARAGRRLASQIAASEQDESESADAQSDPGDGPIRIDLPEDESSDESAETEAASGSADAMELLERFRALAPEADGHWPDPKVVRQALGTIAFRRSFLVELSDRESADQSAAARAFSEAIVELRRHRDRMTVANLRLVFPLARKYLFSGVPLEDLSQEGNIGLLRAVDRYDWRRGFRFSTMATWWVRQAISRSIADSALAIRLPVHVHEVASRFRWEIEALEKTLGRDPTPSELADRVRMPTAKLELLTRCISAPLSLESAESERELHLQDKGDAFAEAELRDVAKTLARAVDSLGKKNAAVIKLRFGLEGVEPRTLEEVGIVYGVTRERARQIEAKAMRMLTHPARMPNLARALGRRDPTIQEPAGEVVRESSDDESRSAPLIASPTAAAREPQIETATLGIDVNGELFTEVREIVKVAERQGIGSLVSTSGGIMTTWVFLDQPQDIESRALAGSMLRLGFTYHPGKGYWI